MARAPISLQQLLALAAIIGVAIWLIRRAGRDVRDALEQKASGAAGLTPEQAEAILSLGLATREELFLMPLKEQALLAASAMAMRAAPRLRASAALAHSTPHTPPRTSDADTAPHAVPPSSPS